MAISGAGKRAYDLPGNADMVIALNTSITELVKFQEGEPFVAAAKGTGVKSDFVHQILLNMSVFEIEPATNHGVGHVLVKKKKTIIEWLEGYDK